MMPMVRIQQCEEDSKGDFKIELRLRDETKVFLYLDVGEKKISGMWKEILDTQFIDIPKQDIKEGEDEE